MKPFTVFLVLGSMMAANAHAASGTATVRLLYWEKNGGYCAAGDDCTDAQYLESAFDTYRAFKVMKVYLRRNSDGAVLGQGSTNSNGDATVSWSTWPWESAPTAYFELRFEEANNRFFVKDSTGNAPAPATTNVGQLLDNASASWGTQRVGTSANPNLRMNLYAAAYWAWASLADSNRMLSDFNNHEIRSFTPTGGPSSNEGSSNRTTINFDQRLIPQTVAHEMGHQAVYASNAYDNLRDYCYPTPGVCSHNNTSQEWQSAGFTEAYAELISVRTFYRQISVARSCRNQTTRCTGILTETTVGTANCTPALARQWGEMLAYLWDVYDSGIDNYGDTLQRPFYVFFDGLAAYPNGNGNRQDDEPFDFFGNSDDLDGRNAADMRFVWATNYSPAFQSLTQLNNNCGGILNP